MKIKREMRIGDLPVVAVLKSRPEKDTMSCAGCVFDPVLDYTSCPEDAKGHTICVEHRTIWKLKHFEHLHPEHPQPQ